MEADLLAELEQFYREAIQHPPDSPAEEIKRAYFVPPEQHFHRGFEVHRFEGGSRHWFYEDRNRWNVVGIGGDEFIYYKNELVWIHQYNGFVTVPVQEEDIRNFLHRALYAPRTFFRPHGPRIHTEDDWAYACDMQGDLTAFEGKERILCAGKLMFHGNFSGRIVA